MSCCDNEPLLVPSKEELIKALMVENPSLDYGAVELCVKTWLENPELVNTFAEGNMDYSELQDVLVPSVNGSVVVE